MGEDNRSQSEVVGVILLTAVVVVLAAVVGTVILSNFTSNTQGEQRVSLLVEVDNSTLTLKHNGGERFDSGDIEVIIRGDPEERTFLVDGEFLGDADPSTFKAGDIWQYTHSQSPGTVRVVIVNQQTQTVLYSRTTVVPS